MRSMQFAAAATLVALLATATIAEEQAQDRAKAIETIVIEGGGPPVADNLSEIFAVQKARPDVAALSAQIEDAFGVTGFAIEGNKLTFTVSGKLDPITVGVENDCPVNSSGYVQPVPPLAKQEQAVKNMLVVWTQIRHKAPLDTEVQSQRVDKDGKWEVVLQPFDEVAGVFRWLWQHRPKPFRAFRPLRNRARCFA